GLPDVEVNGNQIKQVFVNLINNANQAIASDAPSGRIWVTAKRLREGVAVSITDSGPGMTEELAGHVFEPFFTTKGEGEGTGLGLSICQGIVKEHGGRITLDTKPGGGATFTVELPGGARESASSSPRATPCGATPCSSSRPSGVPTSTSHSRSPSCVPPSATPPTSPSEYAARPARRFGTRVPGRAESGPAGDARAGGGARRGATPGDAAGQRAGAARRGRRGSGARGPVD